MKNCWEIKKCGRETGGPKSKELGVCVAAREELGHSLLDDCRNPVRRCCPGVSGVKRKELHVLRGVQEISSHHRI